MHDRIPRILAVIAIVAGVLVVGGGFYVAGSPATRRAYRLDAQRVSALQELARALNDPFLSYQKELPAPPARELAPTLAALAARQGVYFSKQLTLDPETGAEYEYRIIDPTHYELCATFARATPEKDLAAPMAYGTSAEFWKHPAGRHCYTLDAEQEV